MLTAPSSLLAGPTSRLPESIKAKDLRRRHGREAAEAIVSRAVWLPDAERHLVQAIFGEGKSVLDLALLMSQPVRSLRTRVRRIVERLTSPAFAFVALNLERWPATMKRVGDACVFRGLTIKQAAADLNVSYYTVRRHLDVIRTLLETARASELLQPPAHRAGPRAPAPRACASPGLDPRKSATFDDPGEDDDDRRDLPDPLRPGASHRPTLRAR